MIVRGFAISGNTVSANIGISATSLVTSIDVPRELRIYNAGSTPVFLRQHESADAAVATSCPIAPGAVEVLRGAGLRVSAIRESGSGMLYLTPGEGI